MDLNVWCIFASVLIVSAGAARFDLGPQKFYESSSPAPKRDQNADPKEVVLYLTPGQIKALQAGGAVVRPAEPEEDPEAAFGETQPDNEDQSEENSEQEEEQQQEDNNDEAEQQDSEQPEQNQDREEELQAEDLDLEEIFRILNEEQLEQEEARAEQALDVPQVTEETSEEGNSEEKRQIPLRFQIRQNQQQEQQQLQQKNLAPSEQKARSKIYSAIRYQRNEQPLKARVQFARQQQEPRLTQEQQEKTQTEAPLQKRYRLVPYEVVEQPEEPTQEQEQAQDEQQTQQEQEQQLGIQQQEEEEQRAVQQENEEKLRTLLTPLISPEKLISIISQRKNKLSQNEIELQTILKELKQSTKHNDQKYAIEIEKLRENLQKQNALAKAQVIAKTTPQLIGKETQKRKPSQSAKLIKAPVARNLEPQRQNAPRPQPEPVEIERPVPVPVVKIQKVEVPRPVPVQIEKRVPVPVTRNVYVKVNKPYLVERIVPVEIKKEIPVRKPQRVTILRHVWEH